MSPSFPRCAALLLTLLLAAACVPNRALEGGPVDAGARADRDLVAMHKGRAERLERQGELAEAVRQWRIVELLAPEDSAAWARRRAAEARIGDLVRRNLKAARDAAARSDRRSARRAYLRVLANDPLNPEARGGLQAIEVASLRRSRPKIAAKLAKQGTKGGKVVEPADLYAAAPEEQQAGGEETAAEAPELSIESATFQEAPLTTQATGAAAAPQPAAVPAAPEEDGETERARRGSLAPAIDLAKAGRLEDAIPRLKAHLIRFPEDRVALGLLADSHRKLGFALYESGKLRESVAHLMASEIYARRVDPEIEAALRDARSRLAQQAYEKGVRAFNDDLAKAIAFWEESLKYDPAHIRARSYLDKAYKIRETLSNISTAE